MSDCEIEVSSLSDYIKRGFAVVDIRDNVSYMYGNIPGSINVNKDKIYENWRQYIGEKCIIYCKKGETSIEIAEYLISKGIEAYSLKGGYLAWLIEHMNQKNKDNSCNGSWI